MAMSKLLVVFLSFLPIASVFGLNLAEARTIYGEMLAGKHPFVSEVSKQIATNLPLYRFWKIHFVGSIEWTESTKKTGDYLLPLKNLGSSFAKTSDEEELAKMMYLTYLESKLSLKEFSVSLVKSSPLFNEFFTDYQFRVSEAFSTYAHDLAAYLLGADVEVPFVPDELKKIRAKIISGDVSAQYSDEEKDAVSILMRNPNVIKSISEAVDFAKDLAGKEDRPSDEVLLMRTRGMIARSAMGQIAGLKELFAEEFVKVTPRMKNFWPIRWLVYGLFLSVWFLFAKDFGVPVLLIIASETVYFAMFSNLLSTADGMIYGISAAIAAGSSLSYFFFKRRWGFGIVSLVCLLAMFLPTFSTEALLMKNSFSRSVYFNVLKSEVLDEPLGAIQRTVKRYTSLLNESVQSYTDLVYQVLSESELPEALDDQLLEPSAFEERMAFVEKLRSKHPNYRELIDDFVYYENRRIRKANSEFSKLSSLFRKFSSISSDDFKRELTSFIESNFTGRHGDRLLQEVSSTNRASTVTLPGLSVRNVLFALTLIHFALFLRVLGRSEWIVPLAGALALSMVSFVGAQEIFVQFGVPTLTLRGTVFNPLALIVSLVLVFHWFLENTTLRGRERA